MKEQDKTISKADEVLQRMLAKDAFSKWLGLEVDEIGEGFCRLHFQVREDMLNGFGTLHGGVTYAAADSAFAFACNSHGRLSVALSTSMDYLEAGKIGDVLTVEAKEEGLKNKIGVYQIRITNQEGLLLALFKGTSYRTSKEV
ncbi:hydroxyphenylacetyl-CoA thioesterase PaaI [Pontibacter harenae]|uniref:hydroxyphenylacetyl-CoA thioesterase PaaI n=1 Tax=Pontibacter harenae TaxID=2894083 RepID=UPI001E43FBB8|nr:hydroxyphenylacetyl-CoA thioesterase PaaI [Pontibacter harenae]MCC9167963.1 hydroxyphenylacetyl-CoA thioesterase PaaI [Pontibacter harenae]